MMPVFTARRTPLFSLSLRERAGVRGAGRPVCSDLGAELVDDAPSPADAARPRPLPRGEVSKSASACPEMWGGMQS